MKLPSSLKNHFLLTTLIFIILMLIIIFFVIRPSWREIVSIDAKVIEQRIQLETLYTRGQLQKKVTEKYNEIKNEAAFLDEILLKENQELQYITSLESIADSLGLNLQITIGENQKLPVDGLSALPFSFVVSGNWRNIVSWLDKVESLPYYTNIAEITITSRPEDPERTSLGITATTFWQKP